MQKKYDKASNKIRRGIICEKIGISPQDFEQHIIELYTENKMSAIEIVEYIKQKSGQDITARSIQRLVKKYGSNRDSKTAFNNAIQRGRVEWKYKDFRYKRVKMGATMRYRILKRDNYRCVLCGNTSETTLLEIDHIIPICKGGKTIDTNLQTLCHLCNKGKQIEEKER